MIPLHHAGLCAADFDSSLRFYRDGIGLTVLADFTVDADLEPLLGRRTSRVRAVFLGSGTSRDAGMLELLDLGGAGFADDPIGTGTPARGVFLLSFQTPVRAALDRLAALGLGGAPRVLTGPGGQLTATVVDPDGVTVELLNRPMAQL
ncbi:MAG: VOC family protein [Mycobacteriaceae bacterium]|nr:VOC family protein [Mycobacteriaceae bacterium]